MFQTIDLEKKNDYRVEFSSACSESGYTRFIFSLKLIDNIFSHVHKLDGCSPLRSMFQELSYDIHKYIMISFSERNYNNERLELAERESYDQKWKLSGMFGFVYGNFGGMLRK